jgi:hypothetical protein
VVVPAASMVAMTTLYMFTPLHKPKAAFSLGLRRAFRERFDDAGYKRCAICIGCRDYLVCKIDKERTAVKGKLGNFGKI